MTTEAWRWVVAHSEEAAKFLGAIGISTIATTFLIEWWKQRGARKRAAARMTPQLSEYLRHWINTHVWNENAQPNPEEMVQWPGADFKSPLDTKEQMEVFGDLSDDLRNAVYKLHLLARERGEYISSVGEYRELDLEHEGPIAVAEMVLAAHEVYVRVAREAGLQKGNTREDEVESIRTWLVKAKAEWAAAQKIQDEATSHLMSEFMPDAAGTSTLPSK